MDDPDEHCCFGKWAAADARRARRGRRVRGICRDLVDSLETVGMMERTVLDLGCGAGVVAIEAVTRGASHATGYDLSPAAIEEANRLSAESGTGGRTTFHVGDASVEPLERHDVVVLNRVFCCYRNVDALLANSLRAARSVYAFTVPPSSGWRGRVARVVVRLENAWYRIRRSAFRAYVHDLDPIDSAVRVDGFDEVVSRRRLAWDLRVYVRRGDRGGLLTTAATASSGYEATSRTR